MDRLESKEIRQIVRKYRMGHECAIVRQLLASGMTNVSALQREGVAATRKAAEAKIEKLRTKLRVALKDYQPEK